MNIKEKILQVMVNGTEDEVLRFNDLLQRLHEKKQEFKEAEKRVFEFITQKELQQ